MSLNPQAVCPVPQETAPVAREAFPKGNISMQMRDVLGRISADEGFSSVFPKEGQPTASPNSHRGRARSAGQEASLT